MVTGYKLVNFFDSQMKVGCGGFQFNLTQKYNNGTLLYVLLSDVFA
jgi:hypothetical protein